MDAKKVAGDGAVLACSSLLDDRARLEKYIVEPEGLIFDDLSKTQRHLPRKTNPFRLFDLDVTPLSTTLKVNRDHAAGVLLDFQEVEVSHVGKTPKTSTSMRRAPGPPDETVRGSSTNMPFWPGGIDEPIEGDPRGLMPELADIDFDKGLESIPPGFDCGMTFANVREPQPSNKPPSKKNGSGSDFAELNIAELLMDEGDNGFQIEADDIVTIHVAGQQDNYKKLAKDSIDKTDDGAADEEDDDDVIDGISLAHRPSALSKDKDANVNEVIIISKESDVGVTKTEWAEVVNVMNPVNDFYKKVPSMAKTWPFELDIFQKQAIIRLERHESVFVAAHTSAGKTVVAEYAIALSFKHLTRAIYTSPIKALSNQKYREFKDTFEDVGLLTGDIQINPTASCLIMTTEILRSMLYNGSDTIRDLEWVIFDEVHYINDAELILTEGSFLKRGVVWEEVLIMLPQQVNIVLLSATVPNTLQFADWIGRTKQKKIFVISTPKRPVPLEHYLYVEGAPKSQEKLFLIVKADSKLNTAGYTAALEAKSSKVAKRQQYGTKMSRTSLGIQQEKNLYVDVVNMLKKKDQLPVVVFTFSRKRCDRNARALLSLDLTTASEKDRVTKFVRKCVDRLKDSDRNLPQVRAVQELLVRGIGIHHSGILPILKEVVELLFQQGHVKLLFATETFAMGVNMPARTVVFDAVQKHDGIQRRNLNTAEYIQMAGRAGRRGLDPTGMVIVLCKDEIPELSDLNSMMLGKPTLLESKFRLTYSMILNLLSVENLTVEDMMKRSFSEAENQKNMPIHQKQLGELTQKVASLKDVECEMCSSSLQDYYHKCNAYVLGCLEIRSMVIKSPSALSLGRIVLVAITSARPRFAAILKEAKQADHAKPSVFTVLTTRNKQQEEEKDEDYEKDDDWPYYLNAHRHLVIVPDATHEKIVTQCMLKDILVITDGMIRADPIRVCKDWEKRQIPRFKDDQPSESFLNAAQELMKFAQEQLPDSDCSEFDPLKDRALKGIDLYDMLPRVKGIRDQLLQFSCTLCVGFEQHFHQVYRAMKLREGLRAKQLLLTKSLILQPEYESRVQVLKELKYINSDSTVNLKGRVARRIGSNELIITELILNNVFTELEPAEIAALLSCMVFQEKHCSEANLNPVLKKGEADIVENAKRIAKVQRDSGIQDEDYEKQFKFNLAEVVYEWARGTTFTDIMQLTDVQEGVIVRCIQRLDEILRDVKEAAKTVGNPVLQKKMEDASQAIKRDIVFAASLYTQ